MRTFIYLERVYYIAHVPSADVQEKQMTKTEEQTEAQYPTVMIAIVIIAAAALILWGISAGVDCAMDAHRCAMEETAAVINKITVGR